jgi:hypothetical protein
MNKSAQILLYRIILGCPLLLVAPEHALAAPSDPDWKEFQIPDLGTRVDYPAAVFSVSDGKSEVGMGERLSTADRRASLTIYSRANETGETPASYLRKNLRMSQSVIQYQRATRWMPGTISLSNSSHLLLMPYSKTINPVTFPPGRAKLSTKPAPMPASAE